jgi:hypothetical protein
MWNVVCPRRVHKSVGSNPYVNRPRPSSPFPKIYTKIVNKHVSPTGEWGNGGHHVMKIVKEIIKNNCHPGLFFVYSSYVLTNIDSSPH